MKKDETKYAHNPNYCMIFPAKDEEEDVVSTGQS